MLKKMLSLGVVLFGSALSLFAQRQMETLNRGLIAMKVGSGVYTSWRIPGDEWYDVTYNLYRDGSLIAEGLVVSNYSDAAGTASSTYQVAAVVNGKEQTRCDAVSVIATLDGNSHPYIEIPVVTGKDDQGNDLSAANYTVNDISVADLDGDGEYEYIVKRANGNFRPTVTAYTRFEAYKLDGTLLWYINMGPNMINAGHVETDCMAFDFDEDGKAEVVIRGTDGTTFPKAGGGRYTLGDATVNYREEGNTYQTKGEEWIVLCEGATGQVLDSEIFDAVENNVAKGNGLARVSAAFWWNGNTRAYGHRANKFHFGAPYLDGRHPSIYIGRGCYTNLHMCTWDVVNKKLQRRWAFATDDTSDPWYGQGFHNFAIVDVDEDGRDEIVHGNCVVDEFGRRLSSTGLGHGDAQHYSDFDPFRKGQEGFRCLETSPGAVLVDATTNEMLIRWVRANDNGRCLAGKFTNQWPGAQLWTTDGHFWSATLSRGADQTISNKAPGVTMNARIFWDGDFYEETFDYNSLDDSGNGYDMAVRKYGNSNPIWVSEGCMTNNNTKGNPCIQADLFGDWREELVLRKADDSGFRIYSTTTPTAFRNYSLMYDMAYRQGVYWQMTGYNQPPHVSYYLGELEGITLPPPPLCTNGKKVVGANGSVSSADNGEFLYIGECNSPATQSVEKYFGKYDFEQTTNTTTVSGSVAPKGIQVFAFNNEVLSGGTLTGDMRLLKLGQQDLRLEGGTYTYTGNTEIWQGSLTTSAGLPNSKLILKRFSALYSDATFPQGIVSEHGSSIHPAGDNVIGTVTTTRLELNGADTLAIDFNIAEGTNDRILVDSAFIKGFNFTSGKLSVAYNTVIRINILDAETLPQGEYVILTAAKGISAEDLSLIKVAGLAGVKYEVFVRDNNLILNVRGAREAASVVWSGLQSNVWDFMETENFTNGGVSDIFVTGDTVTFNNSSSVTDIQIAETVYPSSAVFEGDKSFTLSGDYGIAGDGALIKNGGGTLTLNNKNTFTGGLFVNSGTLKFASVADEQNPGSLGAYTTASGKLTLGDSAVFWPLNTVVAHPTPITVGKGSVFCNPNSFVQDGGITGTSLTKKGTGTLRLNGSQQLRKVTIEEGTLLFPAGGAMSYGDTLEMKGGTVQMNNSTGAYQSSPGVWYVPTGSTVTFNSATRVDHKNKLVGGGRLNLNIYMDSSTPREVITGDWSEFTGTVQIKNTGSNTATVNNLYGLPNAILNLPAGTTLQLGGNSKSVTGTFKIGHLTGAGSLAVENSGSYFEIGALNMDMTLSGVYNANLIKVGTGRLTMTANTGSSAIDLKEGMMVVRSSKTATSTVSGRGRITVREGTMLYAYYYVGNNQVYVMNGGVFRPGYYGMYGTTAQSVVIQDGGTIEFDLDTSGDTISNTYCYCNGQMSLKGILKLTINRDAVLERIKEGDSFTLFTSRSFATDAGTVKLELPELPAGLAWDTGDLLSTKGTIRVVKSSGDAIASLAYDETVSVSVYDLSGAEVAAFETTYGTVSAKAAETVGVKGVYVLRISSASGIRTRKLVLQ